MQKQEVTAILDSVATAAQYPDDSELTPDSSSDSVAVQEEASHACKSICFNLCLGYMHKYILRLSNCFEGGFPGQPC